MQCRLFSSAALFFILLIGSGPVLSSAPNEAVPPMTVKGATTIGVKQAKKLFDEGAAFIDVRREGDWQAGRVASAYHLDMKSDFTKVSMAKVVPNLSSPVVIYCNGRKCLRSSKASAQAVEWGYKKVYYFRDGFPAWKTDNNPFE